MATDPRPQLGPLRPPAAVPRVAVLPMSGPAPNMVPATGHGDNLNLGPCIVCNVLHHPLYNCPALQSHVRLRLALDGLKTEPEQGNLAVTIKRARLLDQLRKITIQGGQQRIG